MEAVDINQVQDFKVETCPSEIEIFLPIPNYEGLYEISNFGRVKSFKEHKINGKILKPNIDKDGYYQCGIRDKLYHRKWFRIHRLVLLTFVPNPMGYNYTNHKDCNVTNNHISNLEWCDITYNNRYRYLKGWKNPVGSNCSCSKYTEDIIYDICIYCLSTDFTEPMIAAITGTTRGCVNGVKRCNIWKHVTYGLLWE